MKEKKGQTKRIQVVLTPEQYEILLQFRGNMGFTDSEILRNIFLSWLAEKSIISTLAKRKMEVK